MESRAEVSMKARLLASAKAIAVSVLTARLCRRSLWAKERRDDERKIKKRMN